jgi:hypothetical protein
MISSTDLIITRILHCPFALLSCMVIWPTYLHSQPRHRRLRTSEAQITKKHPKLQQRVTMPC